MPMAARRVDAGNQASRVSVPRSRASTGGALLRPSGHLFLAYLHAIDPRPSPNPYPVVRAASTAVPMAETSISLASGPSSSRIRDRPSNAIRSAR